MSYIYGARELALISLIKSEKLGKYANIELDAMLKKYTLQQNDRSLFTALYYGVIERKITLDYIISKYSNIELININQSILNILRLSFYQFCFLDKIPPHAVCDEAVKLALRFSNKGAGSFVNAVLRSFLRDDFKLSDITEPSAKYAYSSWMIDLWEKAYGKVRTIEIMEAQNHHSTTTININTIKTNKLALLSKFKDDCIDCFETHLSESAICIKNCPPLNYLYGFNDGLFYVQDAASQHAVNLLSPKEGDFVIDTCSCPGGKSFAAALLMKNKGDILSLDLHKNKLSLVDSGAEKLGISIIKTAPHDATTPISEYIGKADCVICDVPCSGLGVIKKKPDIRHKDKDELTRLPEIQSKILYASSMYLKKGGRLLYSTCTLNPEENENITNAFLNSNKDFKRIKNSILPLSLFPTAFENDGFFIDIIEKI